MQTFKTISIKQFMLPFLVALLTINVHSQKPKTYYINSTGEKCSKQNAKLKRTVINIDNLWMVQEHYLNDSLRMSGSFLDKRLTQKTGLFTYYYPNGKTSRTVEFKNDIKHGNENTYFVSGKKSMLSNYTNGEVTGHWIWYNEDGSIENEIENITPNTLSELYVNAEYIGGRSKLNEYIRKVDYGLPKGTIAIYDRTLTSFQINEEGKVTEVDIIVHGTKEMDSAIIKHLYNMPKWKAAKKNGEYVASNFVLPIVFSRQSKKVLTDEILAGAFFNSAVNDYKEAKYEKAVFKLLHALSRNPLGPNYHYLLGQAYFKLNQKDFACENWAVANSLDNKILTPEIKEFCNLE